MEAPGIERGAGRSDRLAGALRHRRPSAEAHRDRRQRAAARRVARGAAGPARGQDRRGPDVHAGHERDRRRTRGVAAVRRARRRIDGALGRRHPGRSSASSTPAAASPNPRSGATRRCCSPPTGAATPTSRCYARLRVRGQLPDAQGRADDRPAPERHASSASRITTPQQSEVLQTIIRTIGFGIAGADGARRDLRRRQHDVFGRRQPHPRDRDAARARVRPEPGRRLGARSRRCCSA